MVKSSLKYRLEAPLRRNACHPDGMKAVMVNETDGSYQHMTGFDRKEENHELGGKANVAHRAYWNKILSHFGLSIDDINIGTGGGLIINGDPEAIKSFQNLVSEGTGGAYGVSVIAETGQVILVNLNPNVKMTHAQRVFYELLLDVTDETKPLVLLNLVDGKYSDRIAIASYETAVIDLSDVRAFGNHCSYVNTFSVLGHEIAEQLSRQRTNKGKGDDYDRDHMAGSEFESNMTGAIRLPKNIGIDLKEPKGGKIIEYMGVQYIVAGHLVNVYVLFLNKQVIGVKTPLVPSPHKK